MSKESILISGPLDVQMHGRDALAYRWFIGGSELIVEISGTAFEADRQYLPDDVQEAIETKGQSVIENLLDWDVLPSLVRVTTSEVTYM